MKKVANDIEQTVDQQAQALSKWSDEDFSFKRSPDTWSPKEILGHLIDSAQNNIQRFIRGQYEDTPRIVYSQNDWVRLADYQRYDKDTLIRFWVLMNKHLCRILVTMDPANYERKANTGDKAPELHSLSFLAEDYLSHMIHHLNQMRERTKNLK